MMTVLAHLGMPTGLLVLIGCTPMATVSSPSPAEKKGPFCEIAENIQEYKGADVVLNARYISDGAHEEILERGDCDTGRRIVDIGRRGSSESVANFYAERRRICAARGSSYLCNTSADIEVSGTIELMSGDYVFHIREVHAYLFDN